MRGRRAPGDDAAKVRKRAGPARQMSRIDNGSVKFLHVLAKKPTVPFERRRRFRVDRLDTEGPKWVQQWVQQRLRRGGGTPSSTRSTYGASPTPAATAPGTSP